MANNCMDCDRLQPKTSGSAPDRPAFQQPTMYDHFRNFQKFKQAKEEERCAKTRREELSRFNANFTDFNMSRMVAGEECARFGAAAQPRTGDCDRSTAGQAPVQPQGGMAEDGGAAAGATATADKSLLKKNSLLSISRTPVQCPISACDQTVGVTSVLSHFLRDHSDDSGVQCQEIFSGKHSVLIFDPLPLEYHDNVCLGVLAYGGDAAKSSSRPAERGVCMHNAFLPKTHELLDAHLPILIMACKTSWRALLANEELQNEISGPESEAQQLLVIWLVSVQTTKPVHGTLTAYDKNMSSARSTIVQVRHLSDSQKPAQFLSEDTNYLRLSSGDIDILSRQRRECIHMEIQVNEYDQ